LLLGVGIVVLAITFGSWLGCTSTTTTEPPVNAFDSKTWKDLEQTNREPYPRRAMADELVGQRALHGKTRAEVIEMLGEPTETQYFADYGAVYWVGPQRGFMAIDSEWLAIRFDDSERVIETKLTTD
jgi:hypothetical protein